MVWDFRYPQIAPNIRSLILQPERDLSHKKKNGRIFSMKYWLFNTVGNRVGFHPDIKPEQPKGPFCFIAHLVLKSLINVTCFWKSVKLIRTE